MCFRGPLQGREANSASVGRGINRKNGAHGEGKISGKLKGLSSHSLRKMCSVQTLTVGILAGGKGARLSGRDKGMLVFEGEPFVAQLLSGVRRNLVAVPELAWVDTLINCPRNSHFYHHYADRLLCDRQLHAGPSAGIAALLAACTTDWLLTLACDQWHCLQRVSKNYSVPHRLTPRMMTKRVDAAPAVTPQTEAVTPRAYSSTQQKCLCLSPRAACCS